MTIQTNPGVPIIIVLTKRTEKPMYALFYYNLTESDTSINWSYHKILLDYYYFSKKKKLHLKIV